MRKHAFICILSSSLILGLFTITARAQIQNRAPLHQNPYMELPLGQIKAHGWLEEQLNRMKSGMTGHLDERYAEVVGSRNAWLGGDGDAWERGPYWIDGLLPLAYLTNDKALQEKVQHWVDWTLEHQRKDGYIGPLPPKEKTAYEPGLQKEPAEDWWPRMVMLKVLKQYYEATGDKKVIKALSKYFKYQLETLPQKPLDTWSFWANRRGADNLMVVYWLYNITGEKYLLDLGTLLYEQTYPYTDIFMNAFPKASADLSHLYPYNIRNSYPYDKRITRQMHVGQLQSFHCVNFAQGLKTPVIYYQQDPDSIYITAVKRALKDIRLFHGQAQGMYGGDEPLHGNAPTQGIEFCSIVEMLFSLESMLPVTGDVSFADQVEKIAYNAMPTQATDDFNYRQYFQSANQVMITKTKRNFFEDNSHKATDLVYGLLTGYTCCTANMHQGWPKLVQNLWYQTADGGVAALIYGPSELNTTLPGGQKIRVVEETQYPFDDQVSFKVNTRKDVIFPLHLRIPTWAKKVRVSINGKPIEQIAQRGTILKLNRLWKDGDIVNVTFPMDIEISRWAEQSVAVERGPLVYALKIEEHWQKHHDDEYGEYFEVLPGNDWNYGLVEKAIQSPNTSFEVVKKDIPGDQYPWNLSGAPIHLVAKAKKIPSWTIYNNMPGPLPMPFVATEGAEQEITLVPYGCTTLRVTEFPVVH
ncbi:hypothetical protein COR50_01740 [Chitinophaga caeni]|uniref:Glycosyl hydrolase n=2 Tax=Chitinophaga caeni TaxID=2029983 RepID=A0A291R0I9_9BACT|nr:hypothetical protein COR50_01740 [Chitinophaga caeni]